MHVTDGKDPDEFIRKEGRDAFAKLIENAQTGMDYQVEATLAQCDLETLGGEGRSGVQGAALFPAVPQRGGGGRTDPAPCPAPDH